MAMKQPKKSVERTFSSIVENELKIKNIKILIAVNSAGKEFLFIPEGTDVVVTKPPPMPPPRTPKPGQGIKPQMFKYTYPDGDPGWCWPTSGGIKCFP
jgi:hypothetical protein